MRTRGTVRTLRLSEIKTDVEVNRPINEAWVDRLIKNWNPQAVGVPVVAAQNGHYIVLDGQHRLEAMRQMSALDQRVEVQVIEDLSTPEMARNFVELNFSKPVPAFEKFIKRVTSGDADAVAIAHIVKTHGCLLANQPHEKCIGAVVALERAFNYDKTGEVLSATLATLTAAFGWDSTSFNQELIQGTAQFLRKHAADISAKRLITVLKKSASGASGLLGTGRQFREIHGGTVANGVAEAIRHLYNRGLRNKLGE